MYSDGFAGGGIVLDDGDALAMSRCAVRDCSALAAGGGLALAERVRAVIVDSVISGNSPSDPTTATGDMSNAPPRRPSTTASHFLAARGSAFTAPGQVRWHQADGNTFVEASTDAAAAAELQIELKGLRTVGAADFVS